MTSTPIRSVKDFQFFFNSTKTKINRVYTRSYSHVFRTRGGGGVSFRFCLRPKNIRLRWYITTDRIEDTASPLTFFEPFEYLTMIFTTFIETSSTMFIAIVFGHITGEDQIELAIKLLVKSKRGGGRRRGDR